MAGSVRLDIVAQAQDKATATMKKVSSGLNQVGKDARKLSGAQKKGSAATNAQRKAFHSLGGTLGGVVSKMGGVNLAMAAVAGAAVLAGKKLVSLANETAAYGDNVAKTATRLGVTVEEFQRLDHALKISGSSMDDQKMSFVRLARVANDANKGLKTARESFDRLGVSVTDVDGALKNQPELLAEVADAFAHTADGTEKTALAAELFGRKGTDLLQFLNLGSVGIRKLGDEAERLGVVMSGPAARAAEEYTDSVTKLEGAWDGLKRALGSEVIPMIQGVVDFMTGIIKPTNDAKDAIRSYADVLRRESSAAADQIAADTKRITQALAVQVKATKGSMVAQAVALRAQAQLSAASAKSRVTQRDLERQLRDKDVQGPAREHLNIKLRKEGARLEIELTEIRNQSAAVIKAETAAINANIASIQDQGRILRGTSEDQIALEKLVAAGKAQAAAGQADAHRNTVMEIEDLREAMHIEKARTAGKRAGTRATMGSATATLKRAAAQAKLAEQMAMAVVEATRAQKVHVIEMELLDMEAMAVGNLTSVERAALDVARERLEVQRQQIMAMEDSAEQAMAMEKANARVAISERELGQAIKEADLTAHAQAFGEANAVMGNTSSLMSGLNAEAGAMATGIGDVGSAIGTWGESTESQVAAVDGGIAAGQKLTGALVKDQKMQALILGAMEVARGVALSFTNPIAAGAHFASAALFAAVAGGVMGGKKGGGGRASSRAGGGAGFTPTGGDGAGGGTQQVIVTFGDGVILGSPGQVGKAVAQATGALSGTGMQAAGAF